MATIHRTRTRTSSSGDLQGQSGPAETYKFVAPHPGRNVVKGVLALVVLGLAVSGYVAATTSGLVATAVAVGLLVLAVGLWAALQMRLPQTVTIHNSVIEIRRNGHTEKFDLGDPTVEVLARDGEMAFRCYDGRLAVVNAKDVDWKVFTDVVMHYQNHADRKAEERKHRFSR